MILFNKNLLSFLRHTFFSPSLPGHHGECIFSQTRRNNIWECADLGENAPHDEYYELHSGINIKNNILFLRFDW